MKIPHSQDAEIRAFLERNPTGTLTVVDPESTKERFLRRAHAHWAESTPALYEELLKGGRLNECIADAVADAMTAFRTLLAEGHSQGEAEEQALGESVLPPPERGTHLTRAMKVEIEELSDRYHEIMAAGENVPFDSGKDC